jgi:hypothetical protein
MGKRPAHRAAARKATSPGLYRSNAPCTYTSRGGGEGGPWSGGALGAVAANWRKRLKCALPGTKVCY